MFQLAARVACAKVGCDPAVVAPMGPALCLWLFVPIAVSLAIGTILARGRDRIVVGLDAAIFGALSLALVFGALSLYRAADVTLVVWFCGGIVAARLMRRQRKLYGATGGRYLGFAWGIGVIVGLAALFFVVSRLNVPGPWHWR